MNPYIAIPLALVTLLIAASGVAAVTHAWMLPWNRRRVRSPRVHGWGQLVLAFALGWQLICGTLISDSGTRATGTLIGSGLLLAGLIVMMVGQLAGRGRTSNGTP
ncbi:hypothetical protein ACWEGX_11335 [Streptomyces chartreusis]|uniref:hypothetical protein n=1 Tax=Streptomyces chartreusis TaxID=1969 RepID=UPI0036399422